MMHEDVRRVIAEYDAAHPPECPVDKRQREIREAKEAEERATRARDARRQAEQQQAANNSKAWCDWVDQRITQQIDQLVKILFGDSSPLFDGLGKVVAIEREDRDKEVKAAVEEAHRAVDVKLEALEQRIVQRTEQCFGRADALREVIATERTDRWKEIKAAVEEAQRVHEAKLAALEQRIVQHTEQHIIQHIEQCSGRTHALSDMIATERADRQKEVRVAVEEAQRAFDEVQRAVNVKLEALEQRLKAVPGKLPVAKVWHPQSVTYQAEFLSHEGALWRARTDTAQAPGGSEWVCVARAGRDAVTPNVRGTFSVDETYKQLDIVVCDGAAFIAKHDNPGICPGDDWQLLSRQGRPGRKGETGERGMRGERGEKGETGPSIVSWQIDRERYRASPLMSNGTVGPMLELRPLFEQFFSETNS